MPAISVVIITKNEAANIVGCIASAKKISKDIIVVDSGSTDNTVALALQEQVKVQPVLWKGYGQARNTGARLAANDWIFSLDADERIIANFMPFLPDASNGATDHIIYGFKRINYFGGRKIRHGSFGHDRVFRLYNRRQARWNRPPVHETLTGPHLQQVMTNICLEHYTARDEAHLLQKSMYYARLCALAYRQQGKRLVPARTFFAPAFNFIKDYFFQLGFLDRYPGFVIAKLNAMYTRKKYQHLQALLNEENQSAQRRPALQNTFRKIISVLS